MSKTILDFIIKYKWIIISIIVLLIIIYIAYSRGKSYRPTAVTLPPDIQTGDQHTFDPTQYTDNIWNDIDCVFCFHDPAPYNAALTLSNTQIVAIWNDWNRRYFEKAGNKNLCQVITGEYTIGFGWNAQWLNAVNNFGARLYALKLC